MFLEKSHFATQMRQTEGLQRDRASPRGPEGLQVSECRPAASQNHDGKRAGKYKSGRESMEVCVGSSGEQGKVAAKREILNLMEPERKAGTRAIPLWWQCLCWLIKTDHIEQFRSQ